LSSHPSTNPGELRNVKEKNGLVRGADQGLHEENSVTTDLSLENTWQEELLYIIYILHESITHTIMNPQNGDGQLFFRNIIKPVRELCKIASFSEKRV